MPNGSKFELRKQMNKALKPGGVRILNLSRTILQNYAVRIFTSNAFSICLDGHFKEASVSSRKELDVENAEKK